MEYKRVCRARPVDIMSVPLSDDEEEDLPPPPPPKNCASTSSATLVSVDTLSGGNRPLTPAQLTPMQLNHLLLAKGMVAVHLNSILRRLQRRLSAALRAPTLTSTGRVKIVLDGFEMAVLGARLPLLQEVVKAGVRGRSHVFVAKTHEAFRAACFFPFHALGFREAKLFKPAHVREARAICIYSPPMQFIHRRQKVEGVEETSLTVLAQVAMLIVPTF